MIAWIIYSLCALTALLCSILLLYSYRKNNYRLLLWSGLCFAVLTLNNTLVIVDELIFHSVDFSTWRAVAALSAMIILLYGFIWDEE